MNLAILLVEAIAAVAAVAAIWFFHTDPWTAVFIGISLSIWILLRGLLWDWRRHRKWFESKPSDNADLPDVLRAAVAQFTSGTTELDGKRWRTRSIEDDIHPESSGFSESLGLHPLFSTGQAVLISLGLIGTFFGLTIGLVEAVPLLSGVNASPEDIQKGMKALLGGAQLAFTKSIAGVFFGMLWAMRLRATEHSRDRWVDSWVSYLDGKWPLLTPEQLQVRLLNQARIQESLLREVLTSAKTHERNEAEWLARVNTSITELSGVVEGRADRALAQDTDLLGRVNTSIRELTNLVERKADSTTDGIRLALDPLPAKIGKETAEKLFGLLDPKLTDLAGETKKLTSTATEKANELADTMRQLSESMPDRIGSKTGNVLQDLLAPSFGLLVEEMKKLSDGGQKQIADRMLDGGFRQSLDQASGELQTASVEAGKQVSAAAEALGVATRLLHDVVEQLSLALPQVKEVADGVRGAGEEVRRSLQEVATPLVGIPQALDSARVALGSAAGGLDLSKVALELQAEAANETLSGYEAQNRVLKELQAHQSGMLTELQTIRDALFEAGNCIRDLSDKQEIASGEALLGLEGSLRAFQQTLTGTQQSVEASSKVVFQDAQNVSLEAADRVAAALTEGATQFQAAMSMLVEHSEAVKKSLAAAHVSSNAIAGNAEALRTGIDNAARPLNAVASTLQMVPGQIQQATGLVQVERAALQGLGRQLQDYTTAVKQQADETTARIREYKSLNELLATQMASHLQGLREANDQVRQAWAAAVSASNATVQRTSDNLANYASEVEKRLRLPNDLERMVGSIDELTNTLADLHSVLAKRST